MKKKSDPILEFSKDLVNRGLTIFVFHVICTLLIVVFKEESSVQAVALMRDTVSLYAVLFGGYFGKAGIENYQKIKNEVLIPEKTKDRESLG